MATRIGPIPSPRSSPPRQSSWQMDTANAAPAGVNKLPLLLTLPYLLGTYALFWFGPFSWPVKATWVTTLYVPACFTALTLGFLVGLRAKPRVADLPMTHAFFLGGAIAALLLLVPTAYIYTGKLPWEAGSALADQQAAYSALADQLYATQGSRGPVALLRTAAGPFVFCVLPLGVLLWPSISWPRRIAAIATVLISIDLSVLRGTTRELADILIIGTSAYLVRVGAAAKASGHNVMAAVARRWKGLLIGIVVLSVVIVAVVGRTQIRANGKMATCIGYSQICADLSTGIYARMNDTFAFGSAAVTGYLAQGYYGLSLAAEKPFESTYGIGHSPPLSALFVNLGGDEAWANRTYTFRNRIDAWSDETQWSTMWSWIANDVGFGGALIVTFVLGILWGRTWIDSLAGDLRAAVLFCLLMMTIFYAPANLQIFSTFEAYGTFLFWMLLWLMGRGRRPIDVSDSPI